MANSGVMVAGIENVIAALKQWQSDIAGPVLREAKYAAAGVLQAAIESATPSRTGQARANVIIYQRKTKAVTESAEDLQLLVGYEKKKAYYMYWYEYGKKGQSPRPFFRSTCDGAMDSALAAAQKVIQDKVR